MDYSEFLKHLTLDLPYYLIPGMLRLYSSGQGSVQLNWFNSRILGMVAINLSNISQ